MEPVNVPAKFEVRNFTRSRDNWGYLKILDVRPWNFSRRIPTYIVITVPKRHGQTDVRTTYCGITALCLASRGKNEMTRHITTLTSAVQLQSSRLNAMHWKIDVITRKRKSVPPVHNSIVQN